MKVQVAPGKFTYYTFPKMAMMVTVMADDVPNIITLAWHTPLSFKPPLYGISIDPRRYSHEHILKSKEFAVNFCGFELVEKLHHCGRHSGRETNKFEDTGLTPVPGAKIRAPLIEECYAHLECKLIEHRSQGDHTQFVGEIVAVSVDEHAFNTVLKQEVRPIYYLGSNKYTTIGDIRRKF